MSDSDVLIVNQLLLHCLYAGSRSSLESLHFAIEFALHFGHFVLNFAVDAIYFAPDKEACGELNSEHKDYAPEDGPPLGCRAGIFKRGSHSDAEGDSRDHSNHGE